MGLIQRPVKQFGFRTYTDDFSAAPVNPTPPPTHVYEIQTAEVDADLDTIYALINGNIDDANIAVGANIATAKLADDAGITTAKLADGSVTTNKIVAGATTMPVVGVDVSSGLSINFNTETAIVTFPPYTTRGGLILCAGQMALRINVFANSSSDALLRFYRDATLLREVTHTIADSDFATDVIWTFQLPVPTPTFFDQPAAGTYTYTIKVFSAAQQMFTSAEAGHFNLVEFA